MIDWYRLLLNSIWVVALAVILCAASFASWEAAVKKRKFRDVFVHPGYQLAIHLSAGLLCLSLALLEQTLWRTLLWVGMSFVFLLLAFQAFKAGRQSV